MGPCAESRDAKHALPSARSSQAGGRCTINSWHRVPGQKPAWGLWKQAGKLTVGASGGLAWREGEGHTRWREGTVTAETPGSGSQKVGAVLTGSVCKGLVREEIGEETGLVRGSLHEWSVGVGVLSGRSWKGVCMREEDREH